MDEGNIKHDISIIVTSRNDDHGGNLHQRMQLFVNGLLAQCKRHNLNAELVLVEWNPPSDRPRLAESLHWPIDSGPCKVRIIEVPSEIHNRFKYSDRLPLFQMIAKNVGIRRSMGKMVLATNIDLLFSDEMMCFLASGRMIKGNMYRVDRYDVPSDVPLDVPIDDQLDFCKKNAFRVCRRDGTLNLKTGEFHRIYTRLPFIYGKFHEFLALYTPMWIKNFQIMKDHFNLYTERVRLHTNACGDFTIMDKEDWFGLRGYPELEVFSFHIDSLLCYMAYHSGIKEKVLRYKIFHIEHTAGWTPEVEKDKSLYKHLSEAKIPRVGNKQFDDWVVQMKREKKPIIFNNESWGLSGEDLPETLIC